MTITLEQARLLSVAEITGRSAQDLMQLQSAVAESLRQTRDLKEWIDGTIALKYDAQAKALRARLGKDTGIIHFDDQGVRVTTDLPKKPVWDQKKLCEIAERITANGDDPTEYLDITYKVAERKYTAWPENLREANLKRMPKLDLLVIDEAHHVAAPSYRRVIDHARERNPELSLQIVEFAREHGRVTMSEVIKLTGASRNTLKLHFRALVERGTLNQHGSGRGI